MSALPTATTLQQGDLGRDQHKTTPKEARRLHRNQEPEPPKVVRVKGSR
jgi:hypothetical protein